MKHILSFDVAKGKSMVSLINSDYDILIDPFEISHNKSDFDDLFNSVCNYDNLIIAMESTSIYHYPVMNYFINKMCLVQVLNPKLVKDFKDTLNKSKTDKKDCLKIARCYLSTIDKFRLKNDSYFCFNPIARQYFSILESLVKYKNRYRQLIDIVFPEFQEIFTNLYSDMALAFIHDFPHPELFYQKRMDFLMNYLMKANGTTQAFRFKRKVIKMKSLANDSLWFVSKNSFDVQNLVQMIKFIQFTKKEIEMLKLKLVDSLKDTHLFKILSSIPFFTDFQVALFLSEVGDISRFDNYSELISFCGIDSVIKQSGKSVHYNGPISKSGNKYARTILYNTCTTMITLASHSYKDHPILLFFRKKQSENKHHYVSVIACCTKLCRIVFALVKSNSLFSK
jgi:Transposase and inactivated derivatives